MNRWTVDVQGAFLGNVKDFTEIMLKAGFRVWVWTNKDCLTVQGSDNNMLLQLVREDPTELQRKMKQQFWPDPTSNTLAIELRLDNFDKTLWELGFDSKYPDPSTYHYNGQNGSQKRATRSSSYYVF